MMKLVALAAALAGSAAADPMDTTRLAFAAICAAQYGDHTAFDVEFARYEATNPGHLTDDQMAELRVSLVDDAELSAVKADPVASAMMESICADMR